LGIFVVGYKSAKANGGNIKFSSAKPEVIKVIELTRLDKHFELFQNTEQAELSFQ
jgi:anti-anti-sigma regulatory factor